MRKLSSFVICFILILTLFAWIDTHFELTGPVKGAVIYVGGTGPGNFSKIQDGIDTANPGDTVFVYNGTYDEGITIDKCINLIGEDRNTTIITVTWTSMVRIISVEADWVNITGFTVTYGDPGIQISGKHTKITNCHIYDNAYGITGSIVYNTTITDSLFSLSGYAGIELSGAGHNVIGNVFMNNNWGIGSFCTNIINNTFWNDSLGIRLYGGFWNNITFNTFLNCDKGIFVYHFAHDNYIANNTIINSTRGIDIWDITTAGGPISNIFVSNDISNCDYGICIGWEAGTNEIVNNSIYSNEVGIYFEEATGSGNITNNEITGNEYGFHCYLYSSGLLTIGSNAISYNGYGFYFGNDIWGVSMLRIRNNTISNNDYGFYFDGDMANNQIYHNNIINNTIQTYDNISNNNQWDDGYPSGGNFWSDYNGSDFYSGPNQDILGSDGIGDTPYFFNFSQDNYPFMEPFGNLSYLSEGWNFVSVPWIQSSTDIEDVLSQLNGTYSVVVWYNATDVNDHWKSYYPSKPPNMNDLKNIDHTMGFGIQITEQGGVVFEFTGMPPSSNQTIPLYTGWNMVGYPSLSNKYRPDALNNLVFGTEVDAVWTYNSGAQKWEEVGDLNYFVVGKGYWIHATQDCIWEVPL